MEIKQYVRVLRAHWVLIVVATLACAAAAAAYAWTRDSVYAAHTQMFVSATADPADLTPSEVYQGALASQSRAESYAQIVSSPPVAQAVIERLDLPISIEAVQAAIEATVPEETVLIDVTVRDESPALAQQMADAVGTEFPVYIAQLESPRGGGQSPVEISVTSRPELPTSPDMLPNFAFLIAGALLGLFVGGAGAVLREALDRRVRDDEGAEAIAGAPILARIPHDPAANRRPLVVVDDPNSPQAEAYRRLRTNLRVVTIDRGRRSLVVTSAVPDEGKSLLVANLGFAFAQAGHRVILIDGDLRRPRLGDSLGIGRAPGLSDLLSGGSIEDVLHRERELPLELLTSGSPVPNPGELLESNHFKDVLDQLTQRAELVILDTPALLPVSDAAVMARLSAAVMMVARVGSTRAEQLDAAAALLRAIDKPPIAAALNGLPARISRAYDYRPEDAIEVSASGPAWDT